VIAMDHDSPMPVRCAGCAFTKGTEANRSDITRLTAEICVLSDEPFYCHANAVDNALPAGQERLCRGFVESLAVRGPVQPWQVAVGLEALCIVQEAEDRARSGLPPLAAEELDARFWARILAAGAQADKDAALTLRNRQAS
jgi:hypothetical protein